MPKRDGDLPIMQVESENDTRGSLFVQFAEDEDEAEALIEYVPNTGRLDLGALRAICAALHDGEASELLRAIEESLAQLEAKVSA